MPPNLVVLSEFYKVIHIETNAIGGRGGWGSYCTSVDKSVMYGFCHTYVSLCDSEFVEPMMGDA